MGTGAIDRTTPSIRHSTRTPRVLPPPPPCPQRHATPPPTNPRHYMTRRHVPREVWAQMLMANYYRTGHNSIDRNDIVITMSLSPPTCHCNTVVTLPHCVRARACGRVWGSGRRRTWCRRRILSIPRRRVALPARWAQRPHQVLPSRFVDSSSRAKITINNEAGGEVGCHNSIDRDNIVIVTAHMTIISLEHCRNTSSPRARARVLACGAVAGAAHG